MVTVKQILIGEFIGLILCASCLAAYGWITFAKDFAAGEKLRTSDTVYIAGMIMGIMLMGIHFYLLYEGIKKKSHANLFVWHLTRGVAALLGFIASALMLAGNPIDFKAFALISVVNIYLTLSMLVIYRFTKQYLMRPTYILE